MSMKNQKKQEIPTLSVICVQHTVLECLNHHIRGAPAIANSYINTFKLIGENCQAPIWQIIRQQIIQYNANILMPIMI